MKIERITESILQYFRPLLSYIGSFPLNGHLRRVLLYLIWFLEDKMQLIVFSFVSWGLIVALWNAR